jgi:hypothetical protein
LQVTKISRGREWTPHKCVLGALIRNGMGILLLLLCSLRIIFRSFSRIIVEPRFYEILC